ncbi:hypothetical protein L207DRAFT_572732 [Hyaloscypha variabilis F]|uniref:Uncharacterized protein n=1 Tax=Hyaloscypha variabilis (strain UAMH 11265 / GT02V1 / F) TaxID=1149755 RepID=A0A2J6QZ12_HYAVF|nr:hypothetical protein L207DRAFT_572732 [Hyaloscypha variabilis F]
MYRVSVSLLRNFFATSTPVTLLVLFPSFTMRSTTLLAFVLARFALASEPEAEFCAPTVVYHYCVLDDCLEALSNRTQAAPVFCKEYLENDSIDVPSYVPATARPPDISSACNCVLLATTEYPTPIASSGLLSGPPTILSPQTSTVPVPSYPAEIDTETPTPTGAPIYTTSTVYKLLTYTSSGQVYTDTVVDYTTVCPITESSHTPVTPSTSCSEVTTTEPASHSSTKSHFRHKHSKPSKPFQNSTCTSSTLSSSTLSISSSSAVPSTSSSYPSSTSSQSSSSAAASSTTSSTLSSSSTSTVSTTSSCSPSIPTYSLVGASPGGYVIQLLVTIDLSLSCGSNGLNGYTIASLSGTYNGGEPVTFDPTQTVGNPDYCLYTSPESEIVDTQGFDFIAGGNTYQVYYLGEEYYSVSGEEIDLSLNLVGSPVTCPSSSVTITSSSSSVSITSSSTSSSTTTSTSTTSSTSTVCGPTTSLATPSPASLQCGVSVTLEGSIFYKISGLTATGDDATCAGVCSNYGSCIAFTLTGDSCNFFAAPYSISDMLSGGLLSEPGDGLAYDLGCFVIGNSCSSSSSASSSTSTTTSSAAASSTTTSSTTTSSAATSSTSSCSPPGETQLVVNPSFEIATIGLFNPPWVLNSLSGITNSGDPFPAYDGNEFVLLNGAAESTASLSQSVSGFVPASSYALSFFWSPAGSEETQSNTCILIVTVGGVQVYFLSVTSETYALYNVGTWYQVEEIFTPLGSTETLEFDLNCGDLEVYPQIALDDITITGIGAGTCSFSCSTDPAAEAFAAAGAEATLYCNDFLGIPQPSTVTIQTAATSTIFTSTTVSPTPTPTPTVTETIVPAKDKRYLVPDTLSYEFPFTSTYNSAQQSSACSCLSIPPALASTTSTTTVDVTSTVIITATPTSSTTPPFSCSADPAAEAFAGAGIFATEYCSIFLGIPQPTTVTFKAATTSTVLTTTTVTPPPKSVPTIAPKDKRVPTEYDFTSTFNLAQQSAACSCLSIQPAQVDVTTTSTADVTSTVVITATPTSSSTTPPFTEPTSI